MISLYSKPNSLFSLFISTSDAFVEFPVYVIGCDIICCLLSGCMYMVWAFVRIVVIAAIVCPFTMSLLLVLVVDE